MEHYKYEVLDWCDGANLILIIDYNNIEYISDHRDCFIRAVTELQPDEILYIMTRTYFREFRNYVKDYLHIE